MLSIVEFFTNDINISVISDDTDVCVLLVHFYHDRRLTCHVTMEATSKERKSIDIQATARLHKDIAGQILTAHALSGCNAVAQLWGIGKTKAGRQLSELGNNSAALAYVVQKYTTTFIAACYGHEEAAIMSDIRFKKVKTAKQILFPHQS